MLAPDPGGGPIAVTPFRETGRASGAYAVGGRVCDSVYLRLDLQPE